MNTSHQIADLIIDQSAKTRIAELRTTKSKPALMLRIIVEGGGCSGFQYRFDLDDTRAVDDHVYDECVITDNISLPLISGSRISFEESLVGAEFKITNPNAVSGCGCGTSFAV